MMEGALKRAGWLSEIRNKTFAIRVITTAKKAPVMTRIIRIIIAAIALLTPSNTFDNLQHHGAASAPAHTCPAANVSDKAS
jgi:hypothetical protein